MGGLDVRKVYSGATLGTGRQSRKLGLRSTAPLISVAKPHVKKMDRETWPARRIPTHRFCYVRR